MKLIGRITQVSLLTFFVSGMSTLNVQMAFGQVDRPLGKNGPSSRTRNIADVETSMTDERKREIMTFVESHQPQLKKLLELLESNRPQQYRRAFGALSREVDRLQGIEKREPERFPIALDLWKNQKSTEFVSAQIALRGDLPKLRKQLHELVSHRRELQLQSLDFDLAAARQRVERLEKSKSELIAVTTTDDDERVKQMIARAKRIRSTEVPEVPNRSNIKEKSGADDQSID